MRTIIYILCLLLPLFVYSQNNREEFLKDFNKELDRVKKNSFEITAKLIDFESGGSCGHDKSAGDFIFEILKSDIDSLNRKQILITIQCAGSYDSTYFKKNENYTLIITKDFSKYWVEVIVERFKKLNLTKYYCIRIKKQ